MGCLRARELFSLYIDGRLNSGEFAELEEHIGVCDMCREELGSLKELVGELNDLEHIELPENYHNELMDKIKRVKPPFSFRQYGAVAAGILLTLITFSIVNLFFSYMGSGKNSSTSSNGIMYGYSNSSTAASGAVMSAASIPETEQASVDDDISFDLMMLPDDEFSFEPKYNAERLAESSDAAVAGAAGDTITIQETARLDSVNLFDTEKIDKSVSIELRVEDISQAVKIINSLGGYNTGSEVNFYNPEQDRQYGTAYITRRVGAYELEYVRDILRSLGEVVIENESQSNYTDQYNEAAVMASNARNEISRLGVLIEKSSTLDNIIYVERRISEIDSQLDSYIGRMRQITAMTSEPYIRISLSTHQPYELIESKISFSRRVEIAFNASVSFTRQAFEGFTIFIVSSVVPLIAFAVVALIAVLIIRKAVRWKR